MKFLILLLTLGLSITAFSITENTLSDEDKEQLMKEVDGTRKLISSWIEDDECD